MDAEQLKSEALRLLRADDVEGALRYAQQATMVNQLDAGAWALLGQCNLQLEDYDGAVEGYKNAVKLEGGNPAYYHGLGLSYYLNKDFDNGEKYLTRAAKADAAEPDFRADLGMLLVDKGQVDDGITLLDQCIRADPKNERYRDLLAHAYIRKAYQNWVDVEEGARVPPGMYAVYAADVPRAEEYKAKAEALGSKNPVLLEQLEALSNDIRRMKARRLRGHWWLAFVYLYIGIVWTESNLLAGVCVVVLGVLFFISCLTPMHTFFFYRILNNEKTLGTKLGEDWKKSEDGTLFVDNRGNIYKRPDGMWNFIFSLAFTVAVVPIVTLWNFYKNYFHSDQRTFGATMMGVTVLALVAFFSSFGGGSRTTASIPARPVTARNEPAPRSSASQRPAGGQGVTPPDSSQSTQPPTAIIPRAEIKPDAPSTRLPQSAQPPVVDAPRDTSKRDAAPAPHQVLPDTQTAPARPAPDQVQQKSANALADSGRDDSGMLRGTGIDAMDGENIQLDSGGKTMFVQLHGIQATNEDGARIFLRGLIKGRRISCQLKDNAAYRCVQDDSGQDIASALVQAGLAKQASSGQDGEAIAIAAELYVRQARHFESGDYDEIWNMIDRNCVFFDENGNRHLARDVLPASQRFFSSIRNAWITSRIYNAVQDGDKLIVHTQSELRFELHTSAILASAWVPHIKTSMAMETFQNKGGVWRVFETRRLRPESLRQLDVPSGRPTPPEKAVTVVQLSACSKQCSDAAMQCRGRSCSAEYRSCIASCR